MRILKFHVLPFLTAALIIALLFLLAASVQNEGYKDGYCSGINGTTIGDSRVCNVDGKVVEIPKP